MQIEKQLLCFLIVYIKHVDQYSMKKIEFISDYFIILNSYKHIRNLCLKMIPKTIKYSCVVNSGKHTNKLIIKSKKKACFKFF